MSLPARSAPPTVAIPRRSVLRAALGTLLLAPLAGCGPIALGGPEEYTPPPPGIDDLYRLDLIALLDRAIAGTAAVVEGSTPGNQALSAALATLTSALPLQRSALLTGAQLEKEQEAREDPSPGQTTPPAPADAPADVAALVAVLLELRDLGAAAARQVSGSLARPTAAIAAHSVWIALRLQAAADAGEITPSPSADEIVPTREVPETDPPSIGAESDYHTTIQRAQQEEWYAGYLEEVLAARSQEATRQGHLDRSELHRALAEQLGSIAEEDGAPVVPRQAVYALPGGTLDEQAAGGLPTLLAQGLLIDHLALVGAAPFARRPLPIAAALDAAEQLAPLVDRMDPLPSLQAEDPATGG